MKKHKKLPKGARKMTKKEMDAHTKLIESTVAEIDATSKKSCEILQSLIKVNGSNGGSTIINGGNSTIGFYGKPLSMSWEEGSRIVTEAPKEEEVKPNVSLKDAPWDF